MPDNSPEQTRGVAELGTSNPRRGILLTTLLLILFLANVIMMFFYLFIAVGAISVPRIGGWAPVFLVLVATNVVVLVAIWSWRRWGLFGLMGSTTLLFFMHLAQGETLRNASLDVLGLVVLIVVASSKARCFR